MAKKRKRERKRERDREREREIDRERVTEKGRERERESERERNRSQNQHQSELEPSMYYLNSATTTTAPTCIVRRLPCSSPGLSSASRPTALRPVRLFPFRVRVPASRSCFRHLSNRPSRRRFHSTTPRTRCWKRGGTLSLSLSLSLSL